MRDIVSDFEKSSWKGAKEAAEDVDRVIKHRGCAFHWAQSLFRKLQSYGLSSTYFTNRSFRSLIRKTFALPFLPKNHIRPAFEALYGNVAPNTPLSRFKL